VKNGSGWFCARASERRWLPVYKSRGVAGSRLNLTSARPSFRGKSFSCCPFSSNPKFASMFCKVSFIVLTIFVRQMRHVLQGEF
jgi:hypothetical protein